MPDTDYIWNRRTQLLELLGRYTTPNNHSGFRVAIEKMQENYPLEEIFTSCRFLEETNLIKCYYNGPNEMSFATVTNHGQVVAYDVHHGASLRNYINNATSGWDFAPNESVEVASEPEDEMVEISLRINKEHGAVLSEILRNSGVNQVAREIENEL